MSSKRDFFDPTPPGESEFSWGPGNQPPGQGGVYRGKSPEMEPPEGTSSRPASG